MKQVDIQEILEQAPETIFGSYAKYQGTFQIVGFEKGYAITKACSIFNPYDAETDSYSPRIARSETTRKIALRLVEFTIAATPEEMLAKHNRRQELIAEQKAAAEVERESMSLVRDSLQAALKANGINNQAWNLDSSLVFNIRLDADNAAALLDLLNKAGR